MPTAGEVIVNQRQPNKYYKFFDYTVTKGGGMVTIDILTTLGLQANAITVTNDSEVTLYVIYNNPSYDRIELKPFSEQTFNRDELAIDWIRVINENTTQDGRVKILATG